MELTGDILPAPFLLIAGLCLCSYLPWPGVIKADRSGGDPRTESVAERGENSEA